MESNFKLSTLYPRVYLFTIDDDSLSPLQIYFKALTKRQIDFIRNLKTTNTISYQSFLLNESITTINNVLSSEDMTHTTITPDELPNNIKSKLQELIIQVSFITEPILHKMKLGIAIQSDKKFATDTWQCDVCKARGLDKVRNCKYNEDYTKDYSKDFFVIVGEEEYRDCPMFYKDNTILSAMFECYNLFNVGILPEVGGVADQTEFFSYAISLVAQAQNKNKDTDTS